MDACLRCFLCVVLGLISGCGESDSPAVQEPGSVTPAGSPEVTGVSPDTGPTALPERTPVDSTSSVADAHSPGVSSTLPNGAERPVAPAPGDDADFDRQVQQLQELQQTGQFLQAKTLIRRLQRTYRRHPRARELDQAMVEIRELMRDVADLQVAVENLKSDDLDVVRASQELLRQGDEAARILLRQAVRDASDVSISYALEVLVDISDPAAPEILAAKLQEYPDGPLNKLFFDALSNLTETTGGAVLGQSYQLVVDWQDHYDAVQQAAQQKTDARTTLVETMTAADKELATANQLTDEATKLAEAAKPFEETAATTEAERVEAENAFKTADEAASASAVELEKKTLAAAEAKAAAAAAAAVPESSDSPLSAATTAMNGAKSTAQNLAANLNVVNDARDKSLAAVIKAVADGNAAAIQTAKTDLKTKIDAVAKTTTDLETAKALQARAEQHHAAVEKATTVAKAAKEATAKAATEANAAFETAKTKATAGASALNTAKSNLTTKTSAATTAASAARPYTEKAQIAATVAQEAQAVADKAFGETPSKVASLRSADATLTAAKEVLAGDNEEAVLRAAGHLCYALSNAAGQDAAKFNDMVGDPEAANRLNRFIRLMWQTGNPTKLAWSRKHIGLAGFLVRGARARYLLKEDKVATDAVAASEAAAAEEVKAKTAADKAATEASTAATAAKAAQTLFEQMEKVSNTSAMTAETAANALADADTVLAESTAALKEAQTLAATADAAAKASVARQKKVTTDDEAAVKAAQAKVLKATQALTAATKDYAAKSVAIADLQAEVKNVTAARALLAKSAQGLSAAATAKVVADAELATAIKKQAAGKVTVDADVTATAKAATDAKTGVTTKMTAVTAAMKVQVTAATQKKTADDAATKAAKAASDAKADAETKSLAATKAKEASESATKLLADADTAAEEAKKAAGRTDYVYTNAIVERTDAALSMPDGEFPHPDPEFDRMNLAVHWTALLDVPGDGEYTFWCHINDYVELHIDGRRYSIVGAGNHVTRYTLTPGLHDIDVYYRDLSGGYYATIWWQGPGVEARRTIAGGDIYTPAVQAKVVEEEPVEASASGD